MQVLPLGTGNDLSLTFGWGNAFLPAWLRDFASVYHLLRRIADAQPRELDCWRISITAGSYSTRRHPPHALLYPVSFAKRYRRAAPIPRTLLTVSLMVWRVPNETSVESVSRM